MVVKERWASRVGLVLAMAGNAVGLGNFLRFPAQAVKNGGGAFLIPYLVALLILGLPLMWIEWTMGRYGGQYGHHSAPGCFDAMGRRPIWKYLGVFGLWTNLIIASYYLYIETWTMAYAGFSLAGGFATTEPQEFLASITGEAPNQIFAFSGLGLGLFAVCIGLNIFILSRGLAKGIELVAKIGMPLLILFAAIIAIRGLMISPETDPKAVASPLEGLNFVWNPKYDSLANPAVWLAAAGQIFFTLSIGMGSIHCYASYLKQDDDVALTGATAAWTNEFCEVILGGTILIPISVAYLGLAAVQAMTASGSGFGIGFITFPTLFQNWGALAPAAGFMWFGLLFFAAITSSLAMGQPIVSFLETEFAFTRRQGALALAGMLLPLAAGVAFLHESTVFGEFDYWGGTVALVVFALIETVLFGWAFGIERGWSEMTRGAELAIPRIIRPIIKYVTPTFLIVILIGTFFQPTIGWDKYIDALRSGAELPAWEWSGESLIGKLLFLDLTLPADATAEQVAFTRHVKLVRLLDRIVMILLFAAIAWLVHVAWRRRARTGRISTS